MFGRQSRGCATPMTSEADGAKGDAGLMALVMLLRFQGIGADPEQISHRFATKHFGVAEMVRCAKEVELKARVISTTWSRLVKTPLPAIAALRDGGFLLLGKASEEKVLVQSPLSPRPTLMTQAELEAVWDGRLVLLTRRAALANLRSG